MTEHKHPRIALSENVVNHLKAARHNLQKALENAARKKWFYGLGARFTLEGFKTVDEIAEALIITIKNIEFFEAEVVRETPIAEAEIKLWKRDEEDD